MVGIGDRHRTPHVMNMKRFFAAVALGLTLGLQAGPLNPSQVSAEARWVVHFDLDAFRASKLGSFVFKQFVDPKLQEAPQPGGDVKLDYGALIRQIGAVTAYGTDFQKKSGQGVVIISAKTNTVTILEGLAAAVLLDKPDGPVKKSQEKPYPIYELKSDAVAAAPGEGVILLAKTKAQVEQAAEIILSGKASLQTSNPFSALPAAPAGAFFTAVATSFGEVSGLPAQAKVLQTAEAGRLSLGEAGDKLFLGLNLRAKTAETSTQIRQVVEGLVALLSLSDSSDPDLATLIKGIKVSSTDQLVTVRADFPLDDALKKAAEKTGAPAPKP